VARRGPREPYRSLLVRTELVRAPEFDPRKSVRVASAREVAALTAEIGLHDQEVMVVVALNFQRRVVAVHEAAVGGTHSVAQRVRHVVKVPMLAGASYVYLVHNHPSGRLKPSAADVRFARRIRAALKCVGIPLLDSVIVSMGRYVSLRQAGLLRRGPAVPGP
jgi:DNA repair protein RadC